MASTVAADGGDRPILSPGFWFSLHRVRSAWVFWGSSLLLGVSGIIHIGVAVLVRRILDLLLVAIRVGSFAPEVVPA